MNEWIINGDNNNDIIFIKKSFLDVDGLSYVCKMVKFHHNSFLNYIINIYFKISKKLDKVYNDLKD
jgi:hypothetical protein